MIASKVGTSPVFLCFGARFLLRSAKLAIQYQRSSRQLPGTESLCYLMLLLNYSIDV